jgi:DNA-binding GntR family transcriptional regulator
MSRARLSPTGLRPASRAETVESESPHLSGLARVSPQAGLTEQALEEIRRAIVEGRLPAGSLTSVRALSEALGISRTPVREALVDLTKTGMVSFERNRGVRINDSQGHDIQEIFQLRRMLEIPAMLEAVPRFTLKETRALGRELAAMRAHLDDEPEFMRHDRAFHRVPLEALGNGRMIVILDSLRDQTRVRNLSTVGRSRDLRAIVTEHKAIYEAVRKSHAIEAAQAMERHLLITEELLNFQVSAEQAAAGSQLHDKEEA